MTALVEQPVAMATVTAFSTEAGGDDPVGRQILPDHVDDAAAASAAMRIWLASGAGIELAPGSAEAHAPRRSPSWCVAVPMVMQWP